MPVPGCPGPVRRIAPALRQNCIRSWPNHQLGTESKPKNLSPERSRVTPAPPFPQVSCSTPSSPARETTRHPTREAARPLPFAHAPSPRGPRAAPTPSRPDPPQPPSALRARGPQIRSMGARGPLPASAPVACAIDPNRSVWRRESPRRTGRISGGGSDSVSDGEGFSVGPRGRPMPGPWGNGPWAVGERP